MANTHKIDRRLARGSLHRLVRRPMMFVSSNRLRLFFQPFEKIEIVPVGVANAYHSCTPTLIRWFAVENQPLGLPFSIDAVDVLYLKTYVVESQRILKECEIAFNRLWIRFSRLKDE